MKMLIATIILVHSWYPQACCAETHCRPVSCTTIQTHSDGSISWTGLHFVRDQVHPSRDGYCHVCLGYMMTGLREPYCAFIANTM
jgi:hypothetical protein